MKGYSEREVFTELELGKLAAAISYVGRLDESKMEGVVRCHELARAVGRILRLAHEDGMYCPAGSEGGINHTWLLVPHEGKGKIAGHSILDVYSVGRLPQVELLHCGLTVPHHVCFMPRTERNDIDERMVLRLIQAMMPDYARFHGKPPLTMLDQWFPRIDHFSLGKVG